VFNPSGDNSVVRTDLTVGAGETKEFAIDLVLTDTIGNADVASDCDELVYMLNKMTLGGKTKASVPIFNMVAKLNASQLAPANCWRLRSISRTTSLFRAASNVLSG
jgi:hypothetical protein